MVIERKVISADELRLKDLCVDGQVIGNDHPVTAGGDLQIVDIGQFVVSVKS